MLLETAVLLAAAGLSTTRAFVLPKRDRSDFYQIGTQEHIFPYLAGAGPYFSYPENYGIPVDPPKECKITQVQLLARHGERYPTKSRGKKLLNTWNTLQKYPHEFNGSLAFINDDYEFFIQNMDDLEMETTTQNSINAINPYTGEMDAKKHAQQFLAQYEEFLEDNREFAVFAASSQRVHDTAQYFIDSLGDKFNISLQVVSEEPSAGANTLSPGYSCPAWNPDEYADIIDAFSTDFLKDIATRMNKENHGLNLTKSDAENLFSWCAYELNARGFSEICNLFTPEELIRYSYYDDLSSYYEDGPGYPMIQAVGANYLNASVKLLKESDDLDQKVWLSFTHDTDILNYLTTLGLFDDDKDLDPSTVPFRNHVFHKSWMIPQGARVYTQKYQCKNDSYIRYVVNDAVIPLENCSDGPGFSCEAEEFYDYANQRMEGQNFFEACNTSSVSNTTELTFFWDWNTTQYNATLLQE
ncbi:LANO_0A00166g1_1 [Lachancea nothofagi CBS 11611]|uniref:acid phosphatase n=1 Tax=Lachancea nothofagi CBS 11611 TaxID=1266666 RepID=A0A1G4ILA5_9SACH|nr:LANO_0A00166g1_1 [Lachancea nothofagi CBS 11611]